MNSKRKTTYTTGTCPDSRVVLCDDPEYVGPRTVCTAVSEYWALEIARLLTERDDLPEPEDLEPKSERDYCALCDGSGEGVADGTRCSHCHGTGHEPKDKQPDPEPF